MGCACGKSVNKRYIGRGDRTFSENMDGSIAKKIVLRLSQICFGLLAGCVMLLLIVPMLVYITLTLCLGKKPHFTIPDVTKWFKKGKSH